MEQLKNTARTGILTAALIASSAHANVAFYPLDVDIPTALCDPSNAAALSPELLSYCGFDTPEPSAPPVTLQFSSSSDWAPRSSSVTVRWSSTGATQCMASGHWSGQKALSGAVNTAPLVSDKRYVLTCSNEQHSALGSITVRVRQAVLSWEPPLTNMDGTPITDLSGYRIYWGPSSRAYQHSLDVPDPLQTSKVVELSPGVHYFAITSLNADGNESRFSNEGRKEIR